jgi:hypothetical protein
MNTFTERDIRSGASHLHGNYRHTGGRSMDRESAIRAYIDEPRVPWNTAGCVCNANQTARTGSRPAATGPAPNARHRTGLGRRSPRSRTWRRSPTSRRRARSCRNAITMASVMIDEIRLRAPARPLDEPEP